MGIILLLAWFGHLVCFTGPGAVGFVGLAWARRKEASFWAVASFTAIVALGAQIGWLVHGYRGEEKVVVWDAIFGMLWSRALFVTLAVAIVVALAGIANKQRKQRFGGIVAGLALSLAVHWPLSFYARAVFGLFEIELVH